MKSIIYEILIWLGLTVMVVSPIAMVITQKNFILEMFLGLVFMMVFLFKKYWK